MFDPSIINVAIGVIFIYLLLSLICTAVHELFASIGRTRGKYLFEGIKNLLNDPGFTGLAQQIYNHGLIDGISQNAANPARKSRLPSYMSATNFSLALLDILGTRGVISAAHGDLLARAEQADDAYQLAQEAAAAAPQNPQLAIAENQAKAASEQAHQALETAAAEAQTAYQQAQQAAKQNPADVQLAKVAAQARDQADTSNAALKMLDARRAAIASANDPGDAARIKAAADTLEQALAAGRTIAAKYPDPLGAFQEAISRLPDGHTKESLFVLLDKTRREVSNAEHQVETFRKNLENWFNDAMDRVSGWYKRWTQQIVLCIAFLIICFTNADTLMLVQRLTQDTALRASLVAAAQDAAKLPAPPAGAPDGDDPRIKLVLEKAESLKFPLGWSSQPNDPWRVPPFEWNWAFFSWWLLKLLGIAISTFAVSLGAPFWFDTLSKFVNLRGAGVPPNESRKNTPPK